MPRGRPDRTQAPSLKFVEMESGTTLFRIHSAQFAGDAFNPTIPPVNEGNRFDPLVPSSAGILYAAQDLETAVCEVFVRGLPSVPLPRMIPRIWIKGRMVSQLETTKPLRIVSLVGAGLSAFGQDAWLTACDECEYPLTRDWGEALREWAGGSDESGADGFRWVSRRNNESVALALLHPAQRKVRVVLTEPADSGTGFAEIKSLLARHQVGFL